MLSKKTRAVLSQLSSINHCMIIGYPTTIVKLGKSIQAFINLENYDEPFEEIGIIDFPGFNSVLSLVEEPTIENDKGVLKIHNSNTEIKYMSTKISTIENDARGNLNVLDRIRSEKNEKIGEVNLSSEDFGRIIKASNLLNKLEQLVIIFEKESVTFKVLDKEKSTNTFDITNEGNSTENIKVLIDISSISKLPTHNYKIEIYKSGKDGNLVAIFNSIDVEELQIMIGIKNLDE